MPPRSPEICSEAPDHRPSELLHGASFPMQNAAPGVYARVYLGLSTVGGTAISDLYKGLTFKSLICERIIVKDVDSKRVCATKEHKPLETRQCYLQN